jgi:hypothetical protein
MRNGRNWHQAEDLVGAAILSRYRGTYFVQRSGPASVLLTHLSRRLW